MYRCADITGRRAWAPATAKSQRAPGCRRALARRREQSRTASERKPTCTKVQTCAGDPDGVPTCTIVPTCTGVPEGCRKAQGCRCARGPAGPRPRVCRCAPGCRLASKCRRARADEPVRRKDADKPRSADGHRSAGRVPTPRGWQPSGWGEGRFSAPLCHFDTGPVGLEDRGTVSILFGCAKLTADIEVFRWPCEASTSSRSRGSRALAAIRNNTRPERAGRARHRRRSEAEAREHLRPFAAVRGRRSSTSYRAARSHEEDGSVAALDSRFDVEPGRSLARAGTWPFASARRMLARPRWTAALDGEDVRNPPRPGSFDAAPDDFRNPRGWQL